MNAETVALHRDQGSNDPDGIKMLSASSEALAMRAPLLLSSHIYNPGKPWNPAASLVSRCGLDYTAAAARFLTQNFWQYS